MRDMSSQPVVLRKRRPTRRRLPHRPPERTPSRRMSPPSKSPNAAVTRDFFSSLLEEMPRGLRHVQGLANPVGDGGYSHGAFQLYTKGGEGNNFQRETGALQAALNEYPGRLFSSRRLGRAPGLFSRERERQYWFPT